MFTIPSGSARWCAGVCALFSSIATLPRLLSAQTTGARNGIVLALVDVSKSENVSPASRFDKLDVNARGQTLLTRPKTDGAQVAVVDSTGKAILRVGRVGAGPGEISALSLLRITERDFSVLDVGTMRITTWGLDGNVQKIVSVKSSGFPVQLDVGGFWTFKPMSSGPTVNFGTVTAGDDGTFTSLITSANAPMSEWFPTGVKRPLPSVAIARDEFAFGDPSDFKFAFYGRDGQVKKTLAVLKRPPKFPTAVRVERQVSTMLAQRVVRPERADAIKKNLLEQPALHFANQSPLRLDESGRIWALGIDGDSAVAYVIDRAGGVVTLPIGCPGFEGFWSMAGHWLALNCAPRDELSELSAVRMLLRIVPSAGTGAK